MNQHWNRAFLFLVLALFLFPCSAHAYVDPGILGSLFQSAYVLIFGLLAAWVLKPFQYLKALFLKIKSRLKLPAASSGESSNRKEEDSSTGLTPPQAAGNAASGFKNPPD